MPTDSDKPTAADEVFLSPRVVDREAFDDFSGVLRGIIDNAQALGQSIESKATLAGKALEEFASSEPTMTASIDAAARVMTSMDERIDQIESLLQRAERMSERLGEMGTRFDGICQERAARFDVQLSEVVAQAEARLNTSAMETTTRVEEVLQSMEQSLDQARSDSATMHADSQGRLRELHDQLAGELTDTAAEGREQLRETLTKLEQQIEPTTERIESTTEQLEERLDRLRKQTLALMGPGVRQLESLCQRGGALLGCDPELIESETPDEATPGSLGDLVSRGEKVQEEAETAAGRLESIRAQADTARQSLSESIISSSDWLEKLLEHQSSLDESTAASVDRCREAQSALKQREDDLKARLLEPAQTIEREMQRVDELLQHVRASRVEAETLIERHEQAAANATRELERLEAVIEHAQSQLEPESPVSEKPAADDEALKSIIGAVKSELGGELGKMTRAIESLMNAPRAGAASTIEPKPATSKPRAVASKPLKKATVKKTTKTAAKPVAKQSTRKSTTERARAGTNRKPAKRGKSG